MPQEKREFVPKRSVVYPGISKPLNLQHASITGNASSRVLQQNTKSQREDDTHSTSISSNLSQSNQAAINKSDRIIYQPFTLDWIDLKDDGKTDSKKNLSQKLNSREQKSSSEPKLDVGATNSPHSKTRMSSPSNIDSSSSINLDANEWFDDPNLEGQLAGDPTDVKQSFDELDHLDEPIIRTLMRDLNGVYCKMKIIAFPLSSYDIYKVVLRGWDLWGPLILCTFLAFNLHHSGQNDQRSGPHFADVFVLVWFGSCIVSLNYRLLSLTSQSASASKIKSSLDLPSTPGLVEQRSSQESNLPKKDTSGNRIARILMPPLEDNSFKTLLSPPSIFQLMCVFGYCLVAPCFGLILLKIFSFKHLMFERVVVGLLLGFVWPTICANRILIRYQHPDKRALAVYPIGLFYFILGCMIILNH